MDSLYVCLLLGGSESSMGYRIKALVDSFPDGNFIAIGLDSELSFFQDNLGKPTIASVFSWDSLTNLTETSNFWQGKGIIVATGKWHGKRIKHLFHLMGKRVITIIDSGEPESWSAIPLYCAYRFLWSAKIMAFIAKKLRT